MKMKVFGAAAAIAAGLGVTAAKAETLILAEGLPNGHFHATGVGQPLMECITEGTNGAIDFTYMPGGQLLKMTDAVDGLKNGLADIAFVSVGGESANLPLTSLIMLPGFSVTSAEGTAAFRKLIDEDSIIGKEIEAQGVKPIVVNDLAAYQVVAKQRLDEPAKWSGQKLRVSGSALVFAVNSIGGTPVNFAATEYYVAAQRGTVDGTIMSFASVKPYSVHEISTHYSRNMSLGTSAMMYAINLDRFNGLPEDQQQVILECGRRIEPVQAANIDANEAEIAKEMESLGHDVYDVTPENLEAFAELLAPAADDLVKRLSELDLPAQQALDEYRAALEAVRAAGN